MSRDRLSYLVVKIPLYKGKTVEDAVREAKIKEGWQHVTYRIEKGFQDGRVGKPDIVAIHERQGRCLWADNEENCGGCEYYSKEESKCKA